MSRYQDRHHAGRVLASAFINYAGRSDVTVLALPRGGVPVAYEVARQLGAPLDVLVVRKLGVPGHEELAMGALASGDVQVMNEEVVSALGISQSAIAAAVSEESRELARRERAYRGKRPPFDVSGRTVILVDDGLATGSTMRAAVAALRQRGPERIVVGVPIAAPSTCEELASEVDDIVCAATPEPFYAVALWYDEAGPGVPTRWTRSLHIWAGVWRCRRSWSGRTTRTSAMPAPRRWGMRVSAISASSSVSAMLGRGARNLPDRNVAYWKEAQRSTASAAPSRYSCPWKAALL